MTQLTGNDRNLDDLGEFENKIEITLKSVFLLISALIHAKKTELKFSGMCAFQYI